MIASYEAAMARGGLAVASNKPLSAPVAHDVDRILGLPGMSPHNNGG